MKPRRMSWVCGVWHVWWGLEVHTGFRWGQLRDRDHSENLVVHERIILKCIFKGQMSKNSHTLIHALTPTFCSTDHFEGVTLAAEKTP